jgi:hypothetical protein
MPPKMSAAENTKAILRNLMKSMLMPGFTI